MRKMVSKKTRPTKDKYMERCASAAVLLWDYDGYYDPVTKKGNIVGLAELIDDAFMILNGGEHWDGRSSKKRTRK